MIFLRIQNFGDLGKGGDELQTPPRKLSPMSFKPPGIEYLEHAISTNDNPRDFHKDGCKVPVIEQGNENHEAPDYVQDGKKKAVGTYFSRL